MITTIPFSGFYYSIHSDELDRELENMVSDSSGCHPISDRLAEESFDGVNWGDVHAEYAKEYTEYFNGWLGQEFGITLKFESMTSPREYNFATDRIFAKINRADAIKLYKAVDRERLKKLAEERFTSRSGFISHYSPDVRSWGPLRTWDHNQLGTLVAAAAEQLGSGDWEYSLVEGMSGNGRVSEALYSGLNDKGKRIDKIAYYLRTREERQWRHAG
jgi:hypothetical protein